MITKLLTVFAAIIGCMMLVIVCFLYLCMNAFTIPLFIMCWLICKLIRVRTPRPALYSLMLYPSWRQDKRPSFLDHVSRWCKWQERKAIRKTRRYYPVRAWEERFF